MTQMKSTRIKNILYRLAAALILAGACTTNGMAETFGALEYVLVRGEVHISDCDQELSGALTIPETINGYRVTTVKNRAFIYCRQITSISLPNSLKTIEEDAFAYCDGLTTIVIPAPVEQIGDSPFWACDNLNTISVAHGNTHFTTHNGALYNADLTTLIQFPCGKTGTYEAPEGVARLGEGAFAYCQLNSITLPDSMADLGYLAFYWCNNLARIDIGPANPSFYSKDGILFNKSLTRLIKCPSRKTGNVYIPGSVSTIGHYAFQNCDSLTFIDIPSGLKIIEHHGFAWSDGFSTLNLPEGLHTIGDDAFTDCDKIVSINIPASVTSIGESPLSYCSRLETISVAPNNPSYASVNGALYDKNITMLIQCPALLNGRYELPETLTAIGSFCFVRCHDLTEIVFPESLSSLDRYAIRDCQSLTNLFFPASLSSLGYNAIDDCENLTNVTFMGNAPTTSSIWGPFNGMPTNFTVSYYSHNTGFSSEWHGFPTIELYNPTASWLTDHGLPPNTPIDNRDLNGDGVDLLMAYALNLDPNQNLSNALPKAVVDANRMHLNYYAKAGGINYIIETSTNLRNWTTTGVRISTLDTNGFRTASVNADVPTRFFRLRVEKQ